MTKPRKRKIGLDFFFHDVDTSQDLKLKLINAKYGLVGYGVYMRLLEETYRVRGYYLEVSDDFNILFSNDNNIPLNDYITILNDCIERGLFDKPLYERFKILTSPRILKNYCLAADRRKEVNFISDYLLMDVLPLFEKKIKNNLIIVNIVSLNDNIDTLNVVNGIQRRVEESRGEKSREEESKNKNQILLEHLKEGNIRTDEYLLEFPEPGLKQDAIEVVELMRKTKNPKSELPPQRDEVEKLIYNWLFPDDPDLVLKEDLIKMIEGAGTDDFEKGHLQVKYLLNPEHRAKLLQLEEESRQGNGSDSKSSKNASEARYIDDQQKSLAQEKEENLEYQLATTEEKINIVFKIMTSDPGKYQIITRDELQKIEFVKRVSDFIKSNKTERSTVMAGVSSILSNYLEELS